MTKRAKVRGVTSGQAQQILDTLNAPANADFHSLRSDDVQYLLDTAKEVGYRTPKNSSGSKARSFYSYLEKRAKGPWTTKRNPKMVRVALKPGTKIRHEIADIGAGGRKFNVVRGSHTVRPSLRKRWIVEILHRDYGLWFLKTGPSGATTKNRELARVFDTESAATAEMEKARLSMPSKTRANFVWMKTAVK